MTDVKSANPYDLLGNDIEDSDQDSKLPPRVVEKPVDRKGKRDASGTAPSEARAARGGAESRGAGVGRGRGRGGASGNDGAFRDREAGSANNRSKPTEDGQTRGGRGERGGRGARGARGGRGVRDDRHTRGPPNDHPKQADQSWGANTGASEWQDEQAGAEIAKADGKDEAVTTVDGEAADGAAPPNNEAPTSVDPAKVADPEPEPEDNSKSYAEYIAELAEKKLKLGVPELTARKPNEGSKVKKEWENAKPISTKAGSETEENFMSGLGKGEKARRERAKKEKQVVDVDLRYVEPSAGGDSRGGRGGRGDRGRGGRGGRGGAPDGRSRVGEYRGRGGRGGGSSDSYRGRGGSRGGAGGHAGHHKVNVEGGQVDVEDQSAFPSLGGS